MVTPQLNRLQRDYNELSYFIQRMKKEGKEQNLYFLQKKQQMIQLTMEDLEMEMIERS